MIIVLPRIAFAFDAAKTGDIPIKGKAGSVANVAWART